MAAQSTFLDWSVTEGKLREAIRRIVEVADPLQIIAFGSRARGDHRPDSDLDLAVVIDSSEEEAHRRLPYTVLLGLRMEIDLIVVSKAKYDLHRPWRNSVYNYIDREGVVLYDREYPKSARPDALHVGSRGLRDTRATCSKPQRLKGCPDQPNYAFMPPSECRPECRWLNQTAVAGDFNRV